MSTDVEVVSAAATPASPARFTVVVDDLGKPLYLTEKGRSEGSPAVVAHHDFSLADLCDGDGITLLDLGSPGIVVTDDDERVLGVLPVDVVNDFAAQNLFPGRTMGDEPSDRLLGGDIQLPLARVRCAEPGCGFVNEMSFYDWRALPPCQNEDAEPHRLRKG